MKSYCKTKSEIAHYFECSGYVADGGHPKAVWLLRPLLSGADFVVSYRDFEENFIPCCPAEALGSLY